MDAYYEGLGGAELKPIYTDEDLFGYKTFNKDKIPGVPVEKPFDEKRRNLINYIYDLS